jgi:VanZ family protein
MLQVVTRLADAALRVPVPLRWFAVAAWAAMIFLASNQPGLAVSDDPGVDRPLRQVAHIGVYGVLTVLLAWALCGRRFPSLRVALVAASVALVYGASDEWHQTMVPTRTGRPEDLVWDALGAAIAVGIIVVAGMALGRWADERSGTDEGPTGTS